MHNDKTQEIRVLNYLVSDVYRMHDLIISFRFLLSKLLLNKAIIVNIL